MLCWSHKPHCWKSHATAQFWYNKYGTGPFCILRGHTWSKFLNFNIFLCLKIVFISANSADLGWNAAYCGISSGSLLLAKVPKAKRVKPMIKYTHSVMFACGQLNKGIPWLNLMIVQTKKLLIWPGNATITDHRPGLEVIKLFSCSTQLSMKFQLLIKTKNTNK